MKTIIVRLAVTVAAFALATATHAQEQTAQQRVAELKASLASSAANLHHYQWLETTTVLLNGEQKTQKQDTCYYGADGGIARIPVGEQPAPEEKRGLRGRIAEREKEEMTTYMKSAAALVKTYVPPSPEKIQAVLASGQMAVDILEPGKRIRLDFKDYQLPGDVLGIEIDMTDNTPLALTVSTYMENTQNPVTLDVTMGRLDDGTIYSSKIALKAPAKNLEVDITNSGYERTN